MAGNHQVSQVVLETPECPPLDLAEPSGKGHGPLQRLLRLFPGHDAPIRGTEVEGEEVPQVQRASRMPWLFERFARVSVGLMGDAGGRVSSAWLFGVSIEGTLNLKGNQTTCNMLPLKSSGVRDYVAPMEKSTSHFV